MSLRGHPCLELITAAELVVTEGGALGAAMEYVVAVGISGCVTHG